MRPVIAVLLILLTAESSVAQTKPELGYRYEFETNELDALAEAQQKEMDVEKRKEIVYKAQELIKQNQSMSVLAYMQMTLSCVKCHKLIRREQLQQ